MAHTYASVTEFKRFMVEGGTDYGTDNDAELLTFLESASRTIDHYCNRSLFGSGFGPRTGTNRYDGDGGAKLQLHDDLLSMTSITVLDGTEGTSTTYTDETDFYKGPYDTTPHRWLLLHGEGTNTVWTKGLRTVRPVGSWGYLDERLTHTTLAAAIGDTTGTGITLTAAAEIGHSYLIDSEQVYVRAGATTTPTVIRGANGTTAATHSNGATVEVYRYPEEVVTAVRLLTARRWRQRESGVVGDVGGAGLPSNRLSGPELSILRATVGHLRIPDES